MHSRVILAIVLAIATAVNCLPEQQEQNVQPKLFTADSESLLPSGENLEEERVRERRSPQLLDVLGGGRRDGFRDREFRGREREREREYEERRAYEAGRRDAIRQERRREGPLERVAEAFDDLVNPRGSERAREGRLGRDRIF